MTILLAYKVLKYLREKNLGFCFMENGEMVTREQCEEILKNN
jgi:hypothetical protein